MKNYGVLILLILLMNAVAFLSIDWQGSITGAQVTSATGNVTFTVVALISFIEPNISVTKVDLVDPLVNNVTLISYVINITNKGPGNATNITLFDIFPLNTSFINASPAPTVLNATYFLGNLTNGSSISVNITLNTTTGLPDGFTLNNTVNVSFLNSTNETNNISESETTTISIVATPAPAPSAQAGRITGGGGGGSGGSGAVCILGNRDCINSFTAAVCERTNIGIRWVEQDCGQGFHCDSGICIDNTCQESWICEPFSECSPEGIQTRLCEDISGCGSTNSLPALTKTCEYEEATIAAVVEIPGIIKDTLKEIVQKVVKVIKEKPVFVFVPSSLIIVLLLIVGLGFRNEVRGVLFHMRVKRFKKKYNKNPLKAVHTYFHKIKPEYSKVKGSIFDSTKKMYKEIKDDIEK